MSFVILPLSFIFPPIPPQLYPRPVTFILFPVTFVTLTLWHLPYAFPIHLTSSEIALIVGWDRRICRMRIPVHKSSFPIKFVFFPVSPVVLQSWITRAELHGPLTLHHPMYPISMVFGTVHEYARTLSVGGS